MNQNGNDIGREFVKEDFSFFKRLLLLSSFPVYFIVIGFFVQPFGEIAQGIVSIIRESDFLITDYFVVGGVGASFLNAGILTFALIFIHYYFKIEFDGHTITSCFMMFGFSLFGKNIFNIWLIFLGVYIYAKLHHVSVKKYLYVGCYGTCLSPIITQIMYIGHLRPWQQAGLSIITGVIIGYVLLPIAFHSRIVHGGYSLYNVGFAAGIIATIVASLFKSFGIKIESRLIWATEYNRLFSDSLTLFFLLMIFYAIFEGRKQLFTEYKALLQLTGIKGPDFVEAFSDYTVIFNMGVNGLFATLFVILAGGDLNGPTIGSIFTIVAFSSTGKHIRNIAPIMFGVLLADLTKLWSINEPAAILTLLLSTTLAPIAGEFGVIVGIIAGFLHSSVALNVGVVYSGMNLYNNGFAGGIVAIFLVPVIEAIREKSKMKKIPIEEELTKDYIVEEIM